MSPSQESRWLFNLFFFLLLLSAISRSLSCRPRYQTNFTNWNRPWTNCCCSSSQHNGLMTRRQYKQKRAKGFSISHNYSKALLPLTSFCPGTGGLGRRNSYSCTQFNSILDPSHSLSLFIVTLIVSHSSSLTLLRTPPSSTGKKS